MNILTEKEYFKRLTVNQNKRSRMELIDPNGEIISNKDYLDLVLYKDSCRENGKSFDPIISFMDFANWFDLKNSYTITISKPIQFLFKPIALFIFWLRVKFKKVVRWGYLNDRGGIIIPAIYEAVTPFTKGIAFVKLKNKWGAINKNGEEIIPIAYHHLSFIYEMNENRNEGEEIYIKVRYENYAFLYSLKGDELTDCSFSDILSVNWEAKEILKKNHSFCFGHIYEMPSQKEFQKSPLLEMVKRITTVPYFLTSDEHGNYTYLLFKKGNRFNECKLNGYVDLEISYETGYIIIKDKERIYLISNNGKLYETGGDFIILDYSIMIDEGPYRRLIVLKEDIMIDNNYNNIDEFSGFASVDKELFLVQKGLAYGIINSKGKIIFDFGSPKPYLTMQGMYAKQNGKWGYIEDTGKVSVDFLFESREDVENIIIEKDKGENKIGI